MTRTNRYVGVGDVPTAKVGDINALSPKLMWNAMSLKRRATSVNCHIPQVFAMGLPFVDGLSFYVFLVSIYYSIYTPILYVVCPPR